MFTAHTARLHVFGLIVAGDVLYFWRYNHQGNIQYSGFNFIQDLPRFLVLLLVMQRFRERHWGLNPDVDRKFGPRPECHKATLSGGKGEKIDVTLRLSDKERVMHYGFNSRATNLLSVKSEKLSSKDDLVIKVFWAEATRMSEPKILERVDDIGKTEEDVKEHVPVMLWYKSFENASTAKIRERLRLKTEGARVLYMIIFRKSRPITELTGRNFLHAWWETVKCHLALWKKGVYHRDISPSNLMYRTVNGKIVGVLNDFDLASTKETATGTERTGTVPFMAVKLLADKALQGHVPHAYEHDAESFIWVLVWISLQYDGGKPRKHGGPLDAWLKVDAAGCRDKKSNFLVDAEARSALQAGDGHKENWELGKRCLGALLLSLALVAVSPAREPDSEDPLSKIDAAFRNYLSDPVRPFLEGPGAFTFSSASESEEWELVSNNTDSK